MKMDSISSAETKHSTLLIHCCHHLPASPKTPLPLPSDILPPPFPLNSTPKGLFLNYTIYITPLLNTLNGSPFHSMQKPQSLCWSGWPPHLPCLSDFFCHHSPLLSSAPATPPFLFFLRHTDVFPLQSLCTNSSLIPHFLQVLASFLVSKRDLS